MKFLTSNIKKLQETETLKELLIFREMEPFSPSPENLSFFRKRKPRKNFLYFLKGKLFLYFENLKKTYLYSRKQLFYVSGKVYSEA